MRLVCMRASRSIAGIDGGTNSISRMSLAADSGIDRSTALRSRPAAGSFLRRGLARGAHFRARRHERHQVADVDHADGIVEHLVVDHQPRMAGAGEHLHELAERDLLLDRDDVGARHHDVHDPPLAQAEDVLQHDAFFRRETGLARARLEDIREVGPDRAGLPSEEHPQRPHQPAFAALVRHQAAAAISAPEDCALRWPDRAARANRIGSCSGMGVSNQASAARSRLGAR